MLVLRLTSVAARARPDPTAPPRAFVRTDAAISPRPSARRTGIATALDSSSTDANLIVAVDLPSLTQAFLNYLRLRLDNSRHPVVACRIGSDFPLCLGSWRVMLPEIKRHLAASRLSVATVS